MLLQDYLQATGYQVEQMTEATNFLTQVRQFKPDLILLDFQLIDDVTGLDLLLCLRQQPDLPSSARRLPPNAARSGGEMNRE